MTDPVNAEPDGQQPPRGRRTVRRRWPRRVALGLLLLLIVLASLVILAPRHVARYVLASELDALGVAHEGLDTLELDLLRGRVAIGPLSLTAGAAPARLARLEATVDLAAVLDGRIAIESIRVRGIELAVSRSEQGEVAINGLPLSSLSSADLVPGSLRGEIFALGVGLESVDVTDSHVRIETRWGGELDLALERLALAGFRSWQPEQPTRVELHGKVNEMALRGSGEITPLLEEPTLRLDVAIDDVTLERALRLTKPLKLARAEGRYSIQSRHELSLARSGELSGHSTGTLTLTGADYRVAELIEAAGQRVEIGFETRYRLPEAAGWQLSGRANLSLEQVTVGGPDQAGIAIRALRVGLSEVEASRDAAGNGQLRLTSQLHADDAALRGRLRLSVNMIIGLLRVLQFLAAGPDLQAPASGLNAWAGREVKLPAADLTIAQLSSKGGRFEVATSPNSVTLTLDSVSEATGVRAVAENQTTDAGSLALEISTLRLNSTPEGASVEAVLSARAISVKGTRKAGEATVEAMDAAIESAELTVTPSAVSGRLSGRAGVTQLHSTVGTPVATLDLAAGVATLSEARVTGTADGGSWKIGGAVQASGMAFDVGKPSAARGVARGIDVTGIQLDESGLIVADSIELRGLDVAVQGSYLDRELLSQAGSAEGSTQPRSSGPARPPPAREASDQASTPGKTPPVPLDRIQRALAERGFDPGPVDGLMGRRTRSAIKAFQAGAGLPADGRVSPALVQALDLGGPAASSSPGAVATARQPIRYRIGRIEAEKGTRFHYSDDTVEPDVDVVAVFDTLSIRDLDTSDAGRRWQLRSSSELNELSRMQITGWVTPLRDPPDLDLKLVTEDLELSPFASYTDRYLGLSIEEGQLSTVSEVALERGALDARLELDIHRLQVRPLTEEDAKKIADTLGVSVSTALALIKNAEGQIQLSIPVGGTLEEPDVDPSDAVNKAVGNVVSALLPTSWIAALFAGSPDDAKFEPVIFDAGSSELTQTARQYLDQLADAMREHPDAVLTVCGRAVAADTPALRSSGVADDQLASWGGALAVERTRAVRRYLVREQDLPAKRVTECRAVHSESDSQPPRVEISL